MQEGDSSSRRFVIALLCECGFSRSLLDLWENIDYLISILNSFVFFSFIPQKGTDAKKTITVLDPKRSNAINIGLTVLPTARTIKGAILKMDSSVINKEGIEVIDRMFKITR